MPPASPNTDANKTTVSLEPSVDNTDLALPDAEYDRFPPIDYEITRIRVYGLSATISAI
ncbi:hypothetical protein ACT8ZS_00200 [Paenibacillus sp. M.A.Huq-84]